MENATKFAVILSVIALLFSGVAVFSGEPTKTVKEIYEKNVGVSAGPEKTQHQYFKAGSTDGGRYATTSEVATYTTTAGMFNGTPTNIDWENNQDITISFSATSTWEYVPEVGNATTIYWRNASSSATATQTFAAVDAGVDIQNTEGGDLVLNGLDWAEITFIRESNDLVTVLFEEHVEGD